MYCIGERGMAGSVAKMVLLLRGMSNHPALVLRNANFRTAQAIREHQTALKVTKVLFTTSTHRHSTPKNPDRFSDLLLIDGLILPHITAQ